MKIDKADLILKLDSATVISVGLLALTIPLMPKYSSFFLIVLAFFCLVRRLILKERIDYQLVLVLIVMMFVVRLIGLFWTDDIKTALKTIERDSALLAFPIIFFIAPKINRFIRVSIFSFVVMSSILLLYSHYRFFFLALSSKTGVINFFFEYLKAPSENSSQILNWSFGHYSFMSMITIYSIILIFYAKEKLFENKIFRTTFLIMVFNFCLITGSRIGLILFFILLTFLIVHFFSIPLKTLMAFVIGAIIIFSLTLIIGNKVIPVHENDFVRYQFSIISINAIKERPIFGFGTNGQGRVIQSEERARRAGFSSTIYYGMGVNHPHNQFLTEVLQFGLFGSLPFFLMLLTMIKDAIKNKRVYLFALFIVSTLFMCVESPLNSNKGIIPFLFIISCMSAFPFYFKDESDLSKEIVTNRYL
jgi:O-antigen ligase